MIQYLKGYTISAKRGWIEPVFNFELGFRLLIHLLGVMHVSRQGFIAIMSVLCQVPVFYFIYKRAKRPELSILIYFTFGLFTFSFSGIRQMIAMGISLFAVLALEENKKGRFIAWIFLAILFHKSSVLYILIYPLSRIRIRKIGSYLIMFAAFAIEVLVAPGVVFLATKLTGRDFVFQWTGAYKCFLLYVMIWFFSAILIPQNGVWSSYTNYMYVAAAIQCLGMYHMSIGRLGYFFAFFECLLIPEIIEKATHINSLKKILYAGCVLFCLLYYNINTGYGYLGVSPYVTYWQ